MQGAAGIVLDASGLFTVGVHIWWIALRIGAMLMLAPVLGPGMLPARIRLIVALALAIAVAPLLPATPPTSGFDAATLLAVARELAIGAAIGFIFRLAFEATAVAGEMIAQGMGLSFAQMVDPVRGTQSPVMGQWFVMLCGLCFFALDGHLAMVRVVVESYAVAPAAASSDLSPMLDVVPAFAGAMLLAGASLALPIVIAMLVVNIAFGVLARTAPAMNPIAIGMPAALLVGFVILVALTPHLLGPLKDWLSNAAATAGKLVR
jgi:flagellar biosynthetic protein FliR